MSVMFEISYKEPVDLEKEKNITRKMADFGGALTFREEPAEADGLRAIILTCEFGSREKAERAAAEAARIGERVQGFSDY